MFAIRCAGRCLGQEGWRGRGAGGRACWLACLALALSLGAVVVGPGVVAAGEVPLRSKITSVTVFPSGAEVVRRVPLSLAKGEHTLVLNDFPASLLENSIRVEGRVKGTLEIGSVDSRRIYVDPMGQDAARSDMRARLEAELERLRDEHGKLSDRIVAARVQKRFIEGFAWRPPFGSDKPRVPSAESRQEARSPLGAEELSQIFFLIGTSLEKAHEVIRTTRIAQRALDKKIKAVRNKLAALPKKQERRTEIKIHVAAGQPVQGMLLVRYQVAEASWKPIYDVRLTTGSEGKTARLELVRRASLSQRTGEAWDNVALKLSTTRPGRGTSAPELKPLQVMLKKKGSPVPVAAKIRPRSRGVRSMAQDAELESEERFAASGYAFSGVPLAPARERGAKLEAMPFQAVFAIAGRVSVPHTGDAKKLLIAKQTVTPELVIRVVPKLATTAWLYARFTPTGAVGLLPGQAVLYRDGVFVGTSRLPQLPAGEPYELGFGVDDAIKVTHQEIGRSKGETGLLSTSKLDERRFKISLTNYHKRAMKVMVFDQVPYSEEEKVKVAILGSTTPPSQKNFKGKRGILLWQLDMKPGARRDITLAYRITWPPNEEIVTRTR